MAPISQFKSFPTQNIGNTLTAVYTAPALKTSMAIQLDISVKGVTGVQVDITYQRSGTDYYLGKNIPVPLGSALEYIEDKKIVVEPGDSLRVRCATPGEFVDALVSAVEDVNS